MWWSKKKERKTPVLNIQPEKKASVVDEPVPARKPIDLEQVSQIAFPVRSVRTVGGAMDSCNVGDPGYRFTTRGGMPDHMVGWFLSQSFIGFQMCAVLAQQWLINRACKVPAEDATRNGWQIDIEDERLTKLDKQFKVKKHCQEFARFNRVFGIRIAIMCVRTNDPQYYELPFNIDSIGPGDYLGISQVDANWCSPEFNETDLSDPSSVNFYEPEWWRINGKRYHRSHLVIIRYAEVPDLLKPTYQFAGASLPQLIWERVYAAERSANEAPQLLLTKRMNVIKTDVEANALRSDKATEAFRYISEMRDNYGTLAIGEGDDYAQHETSLGDVDSVIMTAYQLVASVAEMPSTKMLGTSPKGFNATGAYEMDDYRETLASIQEHHCTPLLERHYQYACKSLGIEQEIVITWSPLDEPTEAERAQTQLVKAQTAQIWQDLGVVSSEQNEAMLKKDPESGYEFDADEDDTSDDFDIDSFMSATSDPQGGNVEPAQADNADDVVPAETQLNGAQVASMITISQSVAAGTLSSAAGKVLLMKAFGVTSEEADMILIPPAKMPEVEVAEEAKPADEEEGNGQEADSQANPFAAGA